MRTQKRPTGITVIAILIIIGSILLFLAGIAGVTVGTSFISRGDLLYLIGLGLTIIGAIILAIGIGYLIISYGLLKGKGWARAITMVLLFIGIAINVAAIVFGSSANTFVYGSSANMDVILAIYIVSIAVIIISVIILYYLYRPHVKSYFDKISM